MATTGVATLSLPSNGNPYTNVLDSTEYQNGMRPNFNQVSLRLTIVVISH